MIYVPLGRRANHLLVNDLKGVFHSAMDLSIKPMD
jgi:hypothetical protein